jgi:hypothetical protein
MRTANQEQRVEMFTPNQIRTAKRAITKAVDALGDYLTFGNFSDLLMDKMPALRDSNEAHALVAAALANGAEYVQRLTLERAKSALKRLGVTVTKREAEYRVNPVNGSEDPAYYTDSLEDALLTGSKMAENAARNPSPLQQSLCDMVRETGYNAVKIEATGDRGIVYSRAMSLYSMACNLLRAHAPAAANQFIADTYRPTDGK